MHHPPPTAGRSRLLLLLVTAASVASCQRDPSVAAQPDASPGDSELVPPGSLAAAVASWSAGGCPECSCTAETQAAKAEPRSMLDPSTGQLVLAIGADLESAERTASSELARSGTEYVGQTVQLEGKVMDMAPEGGLWFALRDEGDEGGPVVRVVTVPAFQVPPDAIGRHARAEGRVESSGAGTHSVILRATGAEFF